VELAAAPPGTAGVIVREVLRGGPAERAGVLGADRILAIDGEPVTSPRDIVRIVSRHRAGQHVSLGLLRGGQDRLLRVPLGARPDESDLLRSQFLGAPAPRWHELSTVRGSLPSDVAELRGRVVVIDFWASWCIACRLAIPTHNTWHDRYSARGLTVVGITTDPAEYAMQASVALGIDYAVASDAGGGTSRAYRAIAIPTLFVVDREGKVRDVMVGYSSDRLARVETTLRELVGGT
jgi:thiol-disulfide isomerase/thioredoxin